MCSKAIVALGKVVLCILFLIKKTSTASTEHYTSAAPGKYSQTTNALKIFNSKLSLTRYMQQDADAQMSSWKTKYYLEPQNGHQGCVHEKFLEKASCSESDLKQKKECWLRIFFYLHSPLKIHGKPNGRTILPVYARDAYKIFRDAPIRATCHANLRISRYQAPTIKV